MLSFLFRTALAVGYVLSGDYEGSLLLNRAKSFLKLHLHFCAFLNFKKSDGFLTNFGNCTNVLSFHHIFLKRFLVTKFEEVETVIVKYF